MKSSYLGEYETTINIERDTNYSAWQRILIRLGMMLPRKIEDWISSFLPEDTYKIEVVVSGDVTPVRRGKYYGPPELCFPDEGGDVDVIGAWLDGKPFELTKDETQIAADALWEAANDSWVAAAEDASERNMW